MKRIRTCIIGIILTLVSSANAVPVGANCEPNLPEVLDKIYGAANWTPYNAPDELWRCLNGHAKAEARFAAYTQDFGYLPNVTGSASFQSLFNVTATDTGYLGGSPSATFSIMHGNIFRFADNPNCAPLWSSQVNDNSDGMDHMWTFAIIGGPSTDNYAIAWEDLPEESSDFDYQDLVVEISEAHPIPEPATLLLLGIGGIALRKRRKG